jgi:DNA-binding transcriptional regulator YdaS (Cro superfamily)
MTKLDTYLKSGETTARELARRVGVSAPFISDLRRGNRFAKSEVAKKIEQATGGRVSAESLMRCKDNA